MINNGKLGVVVQDLYSQEELKLKIELDGSSSRRAIVSIEGDSYFVVEQENGSRPLLGFGTETKGGVDFVFSREEIVMGRTIVPNWSGSLMIGLDGKVYSREGIKSVKIIDLIFWRFLRVVAPDGSHLSQKWYRPPLASVVRLSDPQMPWNGDFYLWLKWCISRSGDAVLPPSR